MVSLLFTVILLTFNRMVPCLNVLLFFIRGRSYSELEDGAMKTEMEKKTNPENEEGHDVGILRFTTKIMEMDLEIEMNMGEANLKEWGKEQLEMELNKEMKKEENKAMEKKKMDKILKTEIEEKKKDTEKVNKKDAMETEMVTKKQIQKKTKDLVSVS